ncbi:MAG: hypothetical protein K0A89_05475 [ANME-2 cluster archaeon]|nr:hypothetical protein [ANME-2 cluster archaeon]
MKKKELNENGQMMTLEALIASLLIIAAVLFVVSQVPPQAQQGGSYSNVQLTHYGDDLLNILKKSPSPVADYDNLIQYYIGENNYSELHALMEDGLPDNVGYSVSLVSGDDSELLFSNGYPVGEQVVVSEIVVSKNIGLGGVAGSKAEVRKVAKTFPAGSLLIPMDETYQPDPDTSDNYIPVLKGMGLVYHIANGTYSGGNPISVYQLLEDPRGTNYSLFYTLEINTSDKPLDILNGNISNKKFGGGPYVIDADDLTPEIKEKILNASQDSPVAYHLKIHQFLKPLYHFPVVEMKMAPKIAVYPPDDFNANPKPTPWYESKLNDTIGKYYIHSDVPQIVINDTMIINGILDEIDIITIPHADLSPMPADVARILIDWLSNGGTIHAECKSLTTLDTKVEEIDGTNHSWYGLIGVEYSGDNSENQTQKENAYGLIGVEYSGSAVAGKSMIFVGNSTEGNTTGAYGSYANPGSCFDVLAQSGDVDGILPGAGSSAVPVFFVKNSNYSLLNPDTTVLSGAGLSRDSNVPNSDNLAYVSAPFDNGFVTYLAGHDMSKDYNGNPTPHKERLMFQTFFYPGFGKVYDYGVVELQIKMWYK